MNGLKHRRTEPPFHKTITATTLTPPAGVITGSRFCLRSCLVLLFCLLLWPGLTLAAQSVTPVEIVVEGITGDVQKNVLEALTLPYGLVKDKTVDRLWLERFVKQAEPKVLAALEPFGYYSARVAIHIETPEADRYLLRVNVEAGPPIILSEADVTVTGRGASESSLMALASGFPLKKGDVLVHPSYEKARQRLQARAVELGYLDADYTVHEIRVDPVTSSARMTLILATGETVLFL